MSKFDMSSNSIEILKKAPPLGATLSILKLQNTFYILSYFPYYPNIPSHCSSYFSLTPSFPNYNLTNSTHGSLHSLLQNRIVNINEKSRQSKCAAEFDCIDASYELYRLWPLCKFYDKKNIMREIYVQCRFSDPFLLTVSLFPFYKPFPATQLCT